MTNLNNKYSTIQQLYKTIKNDNLSELILILKKNPEYIHYMNKNESSLLSYALDKGAINVSVYLLNEHLESIKKSLIKKDILYTIVNQNKTNAINNFFKFFKLEDITFLYKIKREEPLFYTSIKTLDANNYSTLYEKLGFLLDDKDLLYTSNNGLNFAHIIAMYNQPYCLDLLKKAPNEIYSYVDNDTGSTPFLLASKYANLSIVKNYLEKSEIYQTNFLNDNAVNLSIYNSDISVLSYLLENQIDPLHNNYYDYNSLKYSISNKKNDKAIILFPYFLNQDISDEILEASKNFKIFEPFFINITEKLTEKNIQNLKLNPENICKFFCYVFYNCDDKFLKLIKTSYLWTLFEEIKEEPYYMHQIYLSSIMNRKSMNAKISLLLDISDILHADNNEQYYYPIIENNILAFQAVNSENEIFPKIQKSFCFIASLGTLPESQIKSILNNVNLSIHLNQSDLLLLFSIGIKKRSSYILEYVKQYLNKKSIFLDEESNNSLAIQFNCSESKIDNNYFSYLSKIIKKFNHVPKFLLNNYSLQIINNENPIELFSSILKTLDTYPLYKKEMVEFIVSNLLFTEKNHNELLNLFYKKPLLLFYILKNNIISNPEKVCDNDLFRYILNHKDFTSTVQNWKLIFIIANSKNTNKHQLIKQILPFTKLHSAHDLVIFEEYMLNYKIDNESWLLIIEKFKDTKQFQFILHQYMQYVSIQDSDYNQPTLDYVINHLKLNPNELEIWLSNIISKEHHTDYIIMLYESIYLKKYEINNLINLGIKYSNFSYLQHLLTYYNVKIEELPIEKFWHSENMKSLFNLSVLKQNYRPLNNYLLFINEYINLFTNDMFNKNIKEFINWYQTSSVNYKTKIIVAKFIFSTLSSKTKLIDDSLLVSLCNMILSHPSIKKDYNNYNNINSVFNIIFENKNDSFFDLLGQNKNINNNAFLSNNNNKIMNYFKLKNELMEPVKSSKKINKI